MIFPRRSARRRTQRRIFHRHGVVQLYLFTGTMFAGGKLGVSFSIVNLLWIAVIGSACWPLYAASLGWIAARSGLNTVLMGRFCFGEIGSKLADFIHGFAELGWYACGHRHGRYLAGEDPRSARGADPAVDGAVWYSVLRHRAGGLQGAGRACRARRCH